MREKQSEKDNERKSHSFPFPTSSLALFLPITPFSTHTHTHTHVYTHTHTEREIELRSKSLSIKRLRQTLQNAVPASLYHQQLIGIDVSAVNDGLVGGDGAPFGVLKIMRRGRGGDKQHTKNGRKRK